MRWILDALHYARDRQVRGGIPLVEVFDYSLSHGDGQCCVCSSDLKGKVLCNGRSKLITLCLSPLPRFLSSPRAFNFASRRLQRERQKTNRFRLAKQQLCTCITFFCTFLSAVVPHDYNVKVPNFTFCRVREHKTTTFFFFS